MIFQSKAYLELISYKNNLAKRNYSNKLLKIGNNILKLYPYKIIRINLRYEPIIKSNHNYE